HGRHPHGPAVRPPVGPDGPGDAPGPEPAGAPDQLALRPPGDARLTPRAPAPAAHHRALSAAGDRRRAAPAGARTGRAPRPQDRALPGTGEEVKTTNDTKTTNRKKYHGPGCRREFALPSFVFIRVIRVNRGFPLL